MSPFDSHRTLTLIEQFKAKMYDQMVGHQEKGDWFDRPIISFFPRFLTLSADLFGALVKNDFEGVGVKCVHLANYCMMLASRVGYIIPVDAAPVSDGQTAEYGPTA